MSCVGPVQALCWHTGLSGLAYWCHTGTQPCWTGAARAACSVVISRAAVLVLLLVLVLVPVLVLLLVLILVPVLLLVTVQQQQGRERGAESCTRLGAVRGWRCP